ncbi:hypothetical protein AAFF_G00174020 [Aldrovandia affinis]|uniref:Uncharacterized protein n=1 Tax=Aldrovandia affinis TaxID=143900 RepID=A0AAD7T119_9TELE|nr:hypothetical protein AAFF_G00174020 [Aldrovandia affinis]
MAVSLLSPDTAQTFWSRARDLRSAELADPTLDAGLNFCALANSFPPRLAKMTTMTGRVQNAVPWRLGVRRAPETGSDTQAKCSEVLLTTSASGSVPRLFGSMTL